MFIGEENLSLYNSTRENENIENWASLVKSLLKRLGLGEIWYGTSKECLLKRHSYGNVERDFMINGYNNGSKMLTTPLIV